MPLDEVASCWNMKVYKEVSCSTLFPKTLSFLPSKWLVTFVDRLYSMIFFDFLSEMKEKVQCALCVMKFVQIFEKNSSPDGERVSLDECMVYQVKSETYPNLSLSLQLCTLNNVVAIMCTEARRVEPCKRHWITKSERSIRIFIQSCTCMYKLYNVHGMYLHFITLRTRSDQVS